MKQIPWYITLAKEIENNGGKRLIYRSENGGSKLYLERYYIFKNPDFEEMLHCFHMSDREDLHDHPWDNYNIILQTGYYEYTPAGKFFREPGYKGFRKATDLHRVELL